MPLALAPAAGRRLQEQEEEEQAPPRAAALPWQTALRNTQDGPSRAPAACTALARRTVNLPAKRVGGRAGLLHVACALMGPGGAAAAAQLPPRRPAALIACGAGPCRLPTRAPPRGGRHRAALEAAARAQVVGGARCRAAGREGAGLMSQGGRRRWLVQNLPVLLAHAQPALQVDRHRVARVLCRRAHLLLQCQRHRRGGGKAAAGISGKRFERQLAPSVGNICTCTDAGIKQSGCRRCEGRWCTSAYVLRWAVEALGHICTVDDAGIKQQAAGAVERLVELISSSSSQQPDLQRCAVYALANICCGEDAGIQQRAAGAVEPLVQLITSSQDPDVLQSTAQALANICHGSNACIKQRAAGAVESLAQLISSSQDAGVRGEAVRAMWSICSSDSARIQGAAASAGAVMALVQLAISHQPGGAAAGSSPAQQPAVCAMCSKRGSAHKKLRMRLCGACRAVRYCGERCQRLHWPEHCRECAGVPQQSARASLD